MNVANNMRGRFYDVTNHLTASIGPRGQLVITYVETVLKF
jgi:hypothetical protein